MVNQHQEKKNLYFYEAPLIYRTICLNTDCVAKLKTVRPTSWDIKYMYIDNCLSFYINIKIRVGKVKRLNLRN